MVYPTEAPHAPQTTTDEPEAPKRRGRAFLARTWPFAVTAIVSASFGLAAGNGVGSEPQATGSPEVISTADATEPETITETVVDPVCQAVSEELFDMLETYTADVSIPYSDVVITLVDQLQYGADASTINAMTTQLQDITANVNDITTRVENVSPSYTECLDGAGN